VAIGAHKLAVRDFRHDAFQPIRLADERPDLHSLRSDVVELQHRSIRQAAVRASPRLQDIDDVGPGLCPPLVSGAPALLAVKVTALAHVLLPTLLAPRLAAMEVRNKQDPAAAIADLRGLPSAGRWRRRPGRLGRSNVACPQADR